MRSFGSYFFLLLFINHYIKRIYRGRLIFYALKRGTDYSEDLTATYYKVPEKTLTNNEGIGLIAIGAPLLSVNALHYTSEDLTSEDRTGPGHFYEIEKRDEVYLNLDLHQMGVGGDDSWGARTHAEFTMPGNEKYSYSFCLSPYDSSMGQVQKVARKIKE